MIILGIDPGLAATGFGVLEASGRDPIALAWGTIKTDKHQPHPARLIEIQTCMAELIATYRPDQAAIEKMIFQARHFGQQTSEARGVIVAAIQLAGIPIHQYTPQQAKLAVTNYGRAEKMEVQEAVQVLLSMDVLPRPNHAADALALAYAYFIDPKRETA